MQVVILERNKLVGRKVARQFAAIGATVTVVEEPGAALLDGADVLCGDAFDAEWIAEQVRAQPKLRGVLWTAEPLKRSLRYLEGIDHVLGRRDFESPPRPWEVLMIARRIAGGRAPIAGFVDWGAEVTELAVRSPAERDATVLAISAKIGTLAVPQRVVEMLGELVHELIMNALYDAPCDAGGRALYAANRKTAIVLPETDRAIVRLACDGSRLVLQVRDPFGRLERHHVFDGLARGLAGGEQDRSHGGAGLGLLICHHATSALFFDVVRGTSTEVTAVFELELNLRELRTQAKSLHWWST